MRDGDAHDSPEPEAAGELAGRAEPARRRSRPWLNVVLFALTFSSALLAHTLPHLRVESFGQALFVLMHDPAVLLLGMPFAATLMAILLAHEMGHYLTARLYGVDQSLPYFIPAPTVFGTFGAVILMRSQPRDRSVLLNVAVMGPFAGLLLAIPAAAWGLAHSTPVDVSAPRGEYLWFGSSLLFGALEQLFSPNGANVELHPVGLAGWVGLFVTSLNLIPAGQLDGGHVAYALFGRRQERLSILVAGALLAGGLFAALTPTFGTGEYRGVIWILWALLLFAFGLRHPPVRDEHAPLSRAQRTAGWLALVLFALTFIPVPIQVVSGPSDTAEPAVEHLREPPGEEQPWPAEEFKL